MTAITNTTQLDIYSTVKRILKANPTISGRFRDSDFYEFAPILKGGLVRKFPLIEIGVPNSDDLSEFIGDVSSELEFNSVIRLVMGYEARDNFRTYANAILSQIRSSTAEFKNDGYYFKKVTMVEPVNDLIENKVVIVGVFDLVLGGDVVN